VATSASLTTGIAGRYATALFELAEQEGQLDQVEADLAQIKQALNESEDLRLAVKSPLYSREAQARAVTAVAEAMGVSQLTRNVVGLMGQKRRLFALAAVCDAFAAMMAERRGEITAEVTAAAPLSDEQRASLKEALKAAMGRDVNLDESVDETLIGGLVVKVGSKLIDTSIRSRLAALQNAMREVG
jgi:F-type H+-transporting ATPase subunit delta